MFVDDFFGGTLRWSGDQQGLYLLLLMHQWASGPLPPDPKEICRLIRAEWKWFSKLWPVVKSKFVETSDGFINERLEEHRLKSKAISEKRSKAGSAGAKTKWEDEAPSKMHGKTRSERMANARKLGTHSMGEWVALIEACGSACVRCGTPAHELQGSLLCKDHILPIYDGGSDSIENIQPMCRTCNSSKVHDSVDHRPSDWRERLAKCMANDTKTPNKMHDLQSNPILRGLPRREV